MVRTVLGRHPRVDLAAASRQLRLPPRADRKVAVVLRQGATAMGRVAQKGPL
jgi:hypothetical protein